MRASAHQKNASCASQVRSRCAPGKRVGARGVCASVHAGQARRCAHSRPADPAFLLDRLLAERSRLGPAGDGQVPLVAARQPSAPGGAGRPPLRWGLTASSSFSHAGAQRVLSCRAAWRVLSLRSVRATYQEPEERKHGAKKHQSLGATSSCPF